MAKVVAESSPPLSSTTALLSIRSQPLYLVYFFFFYRAQRKFN
jgi:hypothetical protein